MSNYVCGVNGHDWQTYITAESKGKAKYEYWLDIQDAWPDIPFTAITCRKVDVIPPTQMELAQRQADEWNKCNPVGTTCAYWTFLREGEPSGVKPTAYPAGISGESAVVWFKGVGSVALSHVQPEAA